jgi:uncharacterized protein
MVKVDQNLVTAVSKSLFFVAAAIFLIWMLFQPPWFKNVKAEVTQQPYARTISVTGEGEVISKPDTAVVNLSVVSEAATVKAVTQNGNEKMNKVVAAVKALGVSADDVKTISYNLRPQYRYPENQKAQIAGYELEQSLRIKVRDLTKVEDVVDKGVSAGANQVGQFAFEIDDDSEQKKKARVDAFSDAREKAEAMAKAAGVKIGRVVTFTESGDYMPPMPYYPERSFMKLESDASMPAFEPGSQETKINVTVTYEIE